MRTPTPLPTPENLDAFANPDTLWDWALSFGPGVRPIRAARALFPARPKGYIGAANSLKHYAFNKATAMRARLAGSIQTATVYEGICDQIYSRLPDYAKFW